MNERTNLAPNLNKPMKNLIKCTNALIEIAVIAPSVKAPSNGPKNNAPAKSPNKRSLANVLNNQMLNPINALTASKKIVFNSCPSNNNGATMKMNPNASSPNKANLIKFFKMLKRISNPIKAKVVKNCTARPIKIENPRAIKNGNATFNAVSAKKTPKPINNANGANNNVPRSGKPRSNNILMIPTMMFLMILRIIKPANNLLKKLSPGRIVHSGNVNNVPPNVNNSANSSSPLLIKLKATNAKFVNRAANNGSPNNINGLSTNAFNARFNRNNGNANNNCNGNQRSKSNKS